MTKIPLNEMRPPNYTRGITPSLDEPQQDGVEPFEGFAMHVDDEFINIEEAIQHLSLLTPQAAEREPLVLLRGCIRYALAPWDPIGDGTTGWVYYNGTEWTTYNREEIDLVTADVNANASAITGLQTDVTNIDGRVTANATDITSLETSVTDLTADVSGNSTAISTLDTRVTSAEGNITANASSITTLESTVNDPNTGVGANATAISGLETEVSSIDGELSALSTSYNTVFASGPGGDASSMFRMIAQAGPTGYDATIRLQAKVEGDTFAASQAVLEMDVGAGVPSQIRLIADRTVIASSVGSGATLLPLLTITAGKIRFTPDVEIDGALLINGSITGDHLDINTITASHIVANTITTNEIAVGGVATDNLTDGGTTTGKIATDAVTEVTDAFTAAAIDTDSALTYRDAQTVVVTVGANEKVVLTGCGTCRDQSGAGGENKGLNVKFARDSTNISSAIDVFEDSDDYGTNVLRVNPFSWTVVDEPGAGTYTYKMQIAFKSSVGAGSSMSNRTLIALKAKR